MAIHGNWKLPQELIALSEGTTFPTVLEEWKLSYIENLERGEDSETCLCHHYPIREVCHISNIENGNTAIVGNCCVTKFEGETAFKGTHKIFDALKRIRQDTSASANRSLIRYAYKQKILSAKDRDFYLDIWRKRILSGPQEKWKVRLNERIVTSMARHDGQSNQIQAIRARSIQDVFNDLTANPTKLADTRLITLGHQQGILKDNDKVFYSGLWEKRVTHPSEKQQKWVNDLNTKMIQRLQLV